MEESEIRECLERIKRGDREAFGRLYHHFFPAGIRFLVNKGVRQEEAEDVVSNFLTNIWEAFSRGNGGKIKNFRNYFFASIFNNWLREQDDKRRREQVARQFEEDYSLPDLSSRLRAHLKRMRKALTQLSKQCQKLLQIRYLGHERVSMRELAEEINLGGENSVRTTHHRCMKAIRHIFFNHNDSESEE